MQQLEVGWFGKLPSSPEFLKWNAKGVVVQELDQVFSHALYCCKEAGLQKWKTFFLESPPLEFLFQPKGDQERLVGLACPSQDQAGRVFPFLLFIRGWKPSRSDSVIRDPIRWFPWLTYVKSYTERYKPWRWSEKLFLDGLKASGQELFTHIRSDQEVDALYEPWLKDLQDKKFFAVLKTERLKNDDGSIVEGIKESQESESCEYSGDRVELLPTNYGENFDVRFGLETIGQSTKFGCEWTGMFWRRGLPERNREVVFVNRTFSNSRLMDLILPGQKHVQDEGNIDMLEIKDGFS